MQKIGDKKYKIQRSKGLGENEPKMMWHTTMNPQTRRLIQVKFTDEQKDKPGKETLGDELQARKDFIQEHGAKYLELLDVM